MKAVINQLGNTLLGSDLPQVIPTPPFKPLISTGSESVVKAEIDASYNVSVAGDVVRNKEVHNTRHETNVYKESAAGAIHRLFSENCVTVLEKSLQQECHEAKNSDAMLFAFVSKQISTIESSDFTGWSWKNPCHYSAGMYALEIIEQHNGGRPEVLKRVTRMRDKLSGLRSSHKEGQKLKNQLGCGTTLVGILILLFSLFVVNLHKTSASDRLWVTEIKTQVRDVKTPQ